MIQCMVQHCNESRAEIAARLQTQFPMSTHQCVLRSMNLSIRLWMTLHIRSGDAPIGPLLSDVTIVEWKHKQSLRNLIAAAFPRSQKSLPVVAYQRGQIEPVFNIMALRKICRVQVQWAHNLKDHLRFDHSTRRLYVYPHKVCLLHHLEWSEVFPRDFLLDTIRTLDLLFPYGDKSTENWLESENQPFHRTSSSYMQARASKFEEFRYWRPQLLELYDIYQRPPVSILQMWHDRRNPMQWYTFWLAALIAILSIVLAQSEPMSASNRLSLRKGVFRSPLHANDRKQFKEGETCSFQNWSEMSRPLCQGNRNLSTCERSSKRGWQRGWTIVLHHRS